MEHRFFKVTDGPVWDAFIALRNERIAAEKIVKAFIAEIGADNCYGSDANSYAFSFPDDKRDAIKRSQLWTAHPRIGGAYYPSKRNKLAAELREKVKALPRFPKLDEALKTVGLWPGFPSLIEGHTGYSPFIRFYSLDDHVLVISIPWRKKSKKEMDDYKRKHKKGEWSSAEMEYLLWTPPESLHEMKEWEALKIIDDLTPAKEKTS